MNVDRLSITMDAVLGAAARKAAKQANVSVSAWIAEATADRLRREALREALLSWQSEDGEFTEAEFAAAKKALEPRVRKGRDAPQKRSRK